MTPDEFKFALNTLRLTPEGAASFLRINKRKIERMASGQEEIGPAIAGLLTLMVRKGVTVAQLRQMVGEETWK